MPIIMWDQLFEVNLEGMQLLCIHIWILSKLLLGIPKFKCFMVTMGHPYVLFGNTSLLGWDKVLKWPIMVLTNTSWFWNTPHMLAMSPYIIHWSVKLETLWYKLYWRLHSFMSSWTTRWTCKYKQTSGYWSLTLNSVLNKQEYSPRIPVIYPWWDISWRWLQRQDQESHS